MGSRFLSGDGGEDLLVLQDGTFNLNVAEAKIQNVTPNTTMKFNADKKIISSQISKTDLDFVVLENPLTSGDLTVDNGNFIAPLGDVQTQTIPSLNTEVNNLNIEKLNRDGTIPMTGALDLDSNNIINGTDIRTSKVYADTILEQTPGSDIFLNNDTSLNNNQLYDINRLETGVLAGQTGDILVDNNLDLNSNDIINGTNIRSSNVYTDNIFEKTPGGDIFLNNDTTLINHDLYDIKRLECGTLAGQSGNILVDNNLDLNSNNILNCGSLDVGVINNVVYVRSAADLPTPALGFHPLANLTQYVIVGSVLLTNGLDFSAGGCAVTGIDMGTSSLVFDETTTDIIGFYARDANVYVSNLTIVGGGGHFAQSIDGLFDCLDFDLLAPAPFYGRDRRFRVQSCNILFPYSLGRVAGYGTLNVNNNFINGGGSSPSGVYTVEGFNFTGGLSLEFIGNKVVLFAGAQIANSGALVRLTNNVSPVLSFNAVVISSNIIHPRSNETGITFDSGSRTVLGTISGNTFIRTGGTGALIDYDDISLYNNYNPLSVEKYSINANAGVVDSEPNLKSAIGNSNGSTAINPTRDQLSPTFNDQVLQINSSARFAVQVDMSGGSQAFVANERMTDAQLGTNFLILAVDAAAGVSPNITQTVYVTDMSGTPQQIPNPVGGWTSPSGGLFTTATFTFRYRYYEKDPRKLVTTATFTVSTGNNEQYFIAPGDGSVADAQCEVSGIASNAGVGGTVSLSCTRVFNEGDILNFYISSAGGSSTNIDKGIINVK